MRDVEHVARLSRLALTDQEKERMRSELDGILAYIDKLRALDTRDVPPTSHAVPVTNVMRARHSVTAWVGVAVPFR